MAEEGKEHHEHEKAHEQHESKEEHHEHHEHGKKEHEKPASGEKKELRDSRISMLVFTLAGIVMALASSVLKSYGLSNYITATMGLIALVVLLGFMQKTFKRKVKFFLSGVFAYIFVWLVFWIFLFNM